jgi:hypothetical protein
MKDTASIDGRAECCPARPVRRTKPTITLLQHSEKAALPSQTRAINNFHAAEAAKRVADHTTTLLSPQTSPDTVEHARISPIALVPPAANNCKRVHSKEISEEDESQGDDDERENARTNSKCRKQRKLPTVPTDLELVDADGIPIDVDVQSITNEVSTREAKTADLDVFFGATFDHAGANGKVKKHRKCKMCPYVCWALPKL